MIENQYNSFRDLDRRCVSGGLSPGDCMEAVRMKRMIIESDLNRRNPVAREVLEGRTTFVAVYDSYSKAFRGLRRFIPHRHNPELNERLEHFERIVPNVRHFLRRSLFALDNPVAGLCYGILASFAIGLLWAASVRDELDPGDASDAAGGHLHLWTTMLFAVIGTAVGTFAMVRFRTRDRRRIHAREAAAYMDLSYECHRALDDDAWARLIVEKSESKPDGGRNVVKGDS